MRTVAWLIRRRGRVGAVVFLSLVAGVGCSRGGDASVAAEAAAAGFAVDPDFASNGVAERAEAAYRSQCVTCHGAAGDGKGPAGAALQPPPTDFTAAAVPAHRAFVAIQQGGPAVGKAAIMPAFGSQFSEEELHDMVAYVRAFAP